MKIKGYTLSLLLLLCVAELFSYSYIPNLTSYDKQDYNAGRQNWDIDIDSHGIVYFANTDGLLYNVYGEWVLEKVKGTQLIRSVLVDNDTIWCGGNEYGFFTKSDDNEMHYHFLGNIEGGQVWNIEKYEESIFLHTENVLFIYDKSTGTTSDQYYDEGIWGLVEWNGDFWMIKRNGDIGKLDGFEFKRYFSFPIFKDSEVRRLFIHNDLMHIVMIDGRVFIYNGINIKNRQLPNQLANAALFTGMHYDDNSYCLGSISNGLIQLDNNDKVLNAVNSSHGLIDNTVLAMKVDNIGNIWLGLDYGIAKVELQSAINTVFKDGATYLITDYLNKSYLSTNKGLFFSEDNKPFAFVPKTAGQVWRSRVIDEQLYICHNNGLFTLEEGKQKTIYDETGVMDIARFGASDYFLFSTYKGVYLMKKRGGAFDFIENINLWWNPHLAYDANNECIWADANGSTVVQLRLSKEHTVLKEDFQKMQSFFSTNAGLFFYDGKDLSEYSSGRFIKVQNALINIARGAGLEALDVSADLQTIAFIQEGKVKLSVGLPDGNVYSYDKLLSALGNNIISGNEYISISDHLVRVATDRGVMVFDTNFKSAFKKESTPVVSSVTILNEDIRQIFEPYINDEIHLPAGNKNIQLRLSIDKSAYDVVEYRYRLSPKNDDWSEWSVKNEVLYTQLKGGGYRFFLQSRINGGLVHESTLSIHIDKMWYQTSWIALPIILVLVLWMLGIVFIMSRIHRNKLVKQQTTFKQKDALKTVTLKNEQLLQYTEIISHKNEFLIDVKAGLDKMRNTEAQLWSRKIESEVNNEKKEFLFHKLFSEIHQDFIARITEQYPTLTSNDIRLLSFIRVNLETREVANLMNISSKSVDTNRYRLRKKLGLPREAELNQFVRDF